MKSNTVQLLNVDCMKYLKGCKANAFDLAIVDPPYGIGNFVQTTGNKRGKAVSWNENPPSLEYFNELKRVAKRRIIWGSNYYSWVDGKGGSIVWNKGMKRESNLSVCEIASYSETKRVVYVEIIWQNVNSGEKMIHPCQKPIKLYEWLLLNYAKAGERILDTHTGSGSCALACYKLGFAFVGCEIDRKYYDRSLKRLQQYKANTPLFDMYKLAAGE